MARPGRKKGSKGTVKATQYVRGYMLEGKTKRRAALDAGYSNNSHTSDLDARPAAKLAVRQVQAERELLMQKEGFTFKDIAKRLKKRATDPGVAASTQTDNDKILISVMGYNAPAKVETENTSLIVELGSLSGADLDALQKELLNDVEEAEFTEVEEDWI